MSIKKDSLKDKIKKKQQIKKSVILHSGSFVVGNAMLFAINIIFTPDFLWVLFPFFGWLIALSMHSVIASTMGVKSSLKKSFILHLALFIVTNLLLFVINLAFTPDYLWALYPAFGWGAGLFLHLGVLLTNKVLSEHKKKVVLHIFIYLGVNTLLLVINYLNGGSIDWALFPLIFWGAGLIMHVVVYGTYLAGKPVKPKTEDSAIKKGPPFNRQIDKARAMRKRANLMTAIHKEEEKTSESTSELKVKAQKPKIANKPKKDLVLEKIPEGLTEDEEKELKKTESEVDLEEKDAVCIVHKGAIVGTVYICPTCKTYYCLKCANALIEKGDKCWTCESTITP